MHLRTIQTIIIIISIQLFFFLQFVIIIFNWRIHSISNALSSESQTNSSLTRCNETQHNNNNNNNEKVHTLTKSLSKVRWFCVQHMLSFVAWHAQQLNSQWVKWRRKKSFFHVQMCVVCVFFLSNRLREWH